MMWVLQGNNVTKCSLTIMDANIAWVAKKINKIFGRLMQVLWDEITIECNMKYSYIGIIAYPNKHYVYY
jgi:hypothetical protein